jgi:aminopeptidase-like protein
MGGDLRKTETGNALAHMVEELYPGLRSITGEGTRTLLKSIKAKWLPELTLIEVASGTKALDWVVPPEWVCTAARLYDAEGTCAVDLESHGLHVLNYSTGFKGALSWSELKPHLHTLPEMPDLIPYKTSYYQRTWGICLAYRVWQKLEAQARENAEARFRVEIEAGHNEEGSLTYGELYLPGESGQEMLISAHICHPQLANDNLSGISVATYLAQYVAGIPNRKIGLRVVLVPGTIGAICWLAGQSETALARIGYSFVLALNGVGEQVKAKLPPVGMRSAAADLLDAVRVSRLIGERWPYTPYGYDERQYNTAGIGLGAVRISGTDYGQYPQYHTSGDNLELLDSKALEKNLQVMIALYDAANAETRYSSTQLRGEAQLGRHGAFSAIATLNFPKAEKEMAMYWWVSQGKGHSASAMARLANLPVEVIEAVAEALCKGTTLLKRVQ